MLWDMFVSNCEHLFLFFKEKKKNKEKYSHFDLISCKAPTAKAVTVESVVRTVVGSLGGCISGKALGDIVTLCFVYSLLRPGQCYWM